MLQRPLLRLVTDEVDPRDTTCAALNELLAGCLDLHLQARQARWLAGPAQGEAAARLFDAVGEAVLGYADQLAQRVVAIGGQPEGTSRLVSARTPLPSFDHTAVTARDHLRALHLRLGALSTRFRSMAVSGSAARDSVTEDILDEVTRAAESEWRQLGHHLGD